MKQRSLRATALLSLFFALIALVTLVSSTYAWLSFRTYATVTPLSGAVSEGDGDLLISNSPNGTFDKTCELILRNSEAELRPLTTANLTSFYTVSAQNAAGIATAFREASAVEATTLSGSVYLKASGSAFRVFLWTESIHCGEDAQALAAMRLGLKITTQSGTETHIFALDELGNTSAAEAVQTIASPGSVVASVGANGAPSFVSDPAAKLSDYAAGGTEEEVTPGSNALCTLADGEVAEVEFWLYLEGCDANCINSVQGRDIALQLGFAGAQ